MADAFTGERFLPECTGEIAYEHWHRYVFARHVAAGKMVLDVATGDGYGAALLSTVAEFVCGVDIDQPSVRNASAKYSRSTNLAFVQADASALPFPDGAFDLIASFETIEHIDADGQARMLKEFQRLLAGDGLLLISSPNKKLYSDAREFVNEFHVHELYRDELQALLTPLFPVQRWFHQRGQFWSGIWDETSTNGLYEAWTLHDLSIEPSALPDAMYYLVLASRMTIGFPDGLPQASLLIDRDDSISGEYESNTKRLVEQYKLTDNLIAVNERQTHHIRHLEQLLSEREQLSEKQTLHIRHLEALLAEREQLTDRQTVHLQHLERLIGDRDKRIIHAQRSMEQLTARSDNLVGQIRQLTAEVQDRDKWRWWINYPLYRLGRIMAPRSRE
ncbi:MAG TPA: methyltransferase domain-containing protein [Casimicrobiaceae bacterium]|jgi:ubiquinone/menaquinone biosynthesis C-methylase UbiE